MPGDIPDLVIPIRMDPSKATAALKQVGTAGKKAGDDVEEGAKKGRKAVDDLGNSGESAAEALVRLGKAQIGMQLISTVGAAISSEFKRAADYCKNLAMEFAELRQMMQQVAALKGQQNTNEFTVSEAKKAAAASLTPQEWRSFQEQFQSFGGAYLEGDQARFKDRMIGGKQVSAGEQAEQYQQQIAEFAKARGIPANEIAQLGGALLQFSEGPQTTEGLMSRLGKVYKTLERAPTPVSQLMPQMSRVMAQGASAEEASQMLAIMSEAMPGEEETGVTNTIKAITNQVLGGKGEKLGQQKGMTRVEQIKAAVQAIQSRVGKGEDLDAILHEVAPDLREMRGLKGFLTRGLEAQGFERTVGYQEETPADFVQSTIADYETTDAGQKAKRDADRALARAQAGARHQAEEAVKERAGTMLTQSGELEEGRLANLGHQALGWWSGVDTEQQKINSEAIEHLKQQGIAEMVRQGKRWNDVPELRTSAAAEMFGHGAKSQYQVDEELRRLLKVIADNTGKDFSKSMPGPPLTAEPAGGAGKRGG
jgi:hypothetical protein